MSASLGRTAPVVLWVDFLLLGLSYEKLEETQERRSDTVGMG